MFNYSILNLDGMFKPLLLLLQNNKNKYILTNNKLYVYTLKNNPLVVNTSVLVDLSNNTLDNKLKNNINLIVYSKNLSALSQIYIYGVLKWSSLSYTLPIYEWYERELYEKTKLPVMNLKDIRHLLNCYTLRTNVYLDFARQKYFWVYTDPILKQVKSSNSMRVIL